MKTPSITNVAVETAEYSGVYSLACELPDGLYHVWLDRQTKAVRPTLFKNSHADRGQPGYFPCRRLSIVTPFAQKLIELMVLEAIDKDLFNKAEQKVVADRQSHDLELKEGARLRKIQEASVELYEALKVVVPMLNTIQAEQDGVGQMPWPQIQQAEDAIAKAEGRS